jgi:ENTS family enterobactin (siderophore) exporter
VHLRAFRQRLAPEALLGRVQAGGIALGSAAGLLGTFLAPLLGPKGAVALAFLSLLALGLAYPALSPGRLERLKEGTW